MVPDAVGGQQQFRAVGPREPTAAPQGYCLQGEVPPPEGQDVGVVGETHVHCIGDLVLEPPVPQLLRDQSSHHQALGFSGSAAVA